MTDRRRLPARPDLAAEHLRGSVEADAYVAGRPARLGVEVSDLLRAPEADAPRETQALYGEEITLYERAGDWAWVQLADRYVGWLPAGDLREGADAAPTAATHVVSATRSFVYESASIKSTVLAALPMGSRLSSPRRVDTFAELVNGGFVYADHLAALGQFEPDFVAVAERFLNAPYLWGGKTWLGVDCSGLVQIALARAGYNAPRDTDMQQAEVGAPVDRATQALRRGDLVFWNGHVAIMQDEARILHANGHHMAVRSEPLEAAAERILAAGGGHITTAKRPR